MTNDAPTTQPPAPDGVTRELLHLRDITLRGWKRSDGLWDIEASLLDRKNHDFVQPVGNINVAKGSALHDMWVRLTVDSTLTIVAAVAGMPQTPYDLCQGAARAVEVLKGLRISTGWLSEARARMARDQRCTHMTELLGPLASVAFQTQTLNRDFDAKGADGKPVKIGTCYSYNDTREIVGGRWPDFARKG